MAASDFSDQPRSGGALERQEGYMKYLLTPVCALTLILASGPSARAATSEEALKLTHETIVRSLTQGNLTPLRGFVHPSALGFFYESQQLVQLSMEYTAVQAGAPIIADLTRFTSTESSSAYRVVGDTGIVAMTSVRVPNKEEKKEDPKLQVIHLRLTYVYVREGEAWKLLSWHTSQTPLRKK
jgi:hypothetical protein